MLHPQIRLLLLLLLTSPPQALRALAKVLANATQQSHGFTFYAVHLAPCKIRRNCSRILTGLRRICLRTARAPTCLMILAAWRRVLTACQGCQKGRTADSKMLCCNICQKTFFLNGVRHCTSLFTTETTGLLAAFVQQSVTVPPLDTLMLYIRWSLVDPGGCMEWLRLWTCTLFGSDLLSCWLWSLWWPSLSV